MENNLHRKYLLPKKSLVMHAYLHIAQIITLLAVLASPIFAATRPNILFIIFDDWNGSTHAGVNGCTWIKTPNFDRVAREGVNFTHSFTSNPKCSPCRASILTGLSLIHI